MGFNTSANTVTLTAKLTPIGRKKLVSTNNSLITTFGLGDSDANYNATIPLSTGQIPTESGDIGVNSTLSNSTSSNVTIKSSLVLNSNGVFQKLVEPQSTTITSEEILNGVTVVEGSDLTQYVIDRNDFATDSLVNLFYSFGLPLDSSSDKKFVATTYANGGYSDTSISSLAQNKIIILSIPNSKFGETLDGKSIKVSLPTETGTYTMYSTYEKNSTKLINQDVNFRDTSIVTNSFGDNIAFLFSDDIMRPNGGSKELSWSTGYGTTKPFSLNKKELFNLQTISAIGASSDKIVGVVYLDKGIIVITDPTMVENYNKEISNNVIIEFNSVSTLITQNIVCVANRGEFGGSTNPTFGPSDTPRISEVCLYDNSGNIIAVAKTDRHIMKNVNEFLALAVKIII